MNYSDGLLATKKDYPFEEWRTYCEGENALEQYTEENCRAAAAIFDRLISNLIIETDEREQLVPLLNEIGRKAGIEVDEEEETLTAEREW